MKSALALLVLVATTTGLAQNAQPPARGGTIRGKVTAADTGQPIADADVRVTGGTITTLNPRFAYTGDDGTYEITGLPVGRYTVVASRVGYMRLEYGQQRPAEKGIEVVVSDSAVTDRIDMSLPRGGVIVARVIDEFGEPAAGYSVRVFQPAFRDGARVMAPAGTNDGLLRATDDRGEIRLWGLAPGDYYVGASAGTLLVTNRTQRDRAQTFYPGTSEADARPVTVPLGQEVFIDIPLARVRLSRISGVILGQPTASSPPTISLTRRSAGSSTGHPITAGADGSFNATGLPPAEYVISARAGTQGGTLRLQVSGQDIEGLVLTMKQAVTLRGRLTFDPKPPLRTRWPSTSRIWPVFTEGGTIAATPTISPDWTFVIIGVTGSGVLRFPQLPPDWFLKDVVVDGKAVTDVPLDFSLLEGKPIDVQLTQRLAQLSGNVLDAGSRPTLGYGVVVFPEDSTQWTAYSRFIATARPDQSGRFLVTGLPAGSYLVRAVESLQSGAERNPDTLERLRSGATALTLKNQESANITLRLAP